MCEVTTAAAIGAQLVGAAIKARAASTAGNAQANILTQNAQRAEYAAGDAIQRGDFAAGRTLMKGSATAGAETAAYAAGGVDAKSGSAADVLGDTGALSRFDAQIAQHNGVNEAYGFEQQASQFRTQAQLAQQEGNSNAAGAILGGIGGAATFNTKPLSIAGQGEPAGSTGSGWD